MSKAVILATAGNESAGANNETMTLTQKAKQAVQNENHYYPSQQKVKEKYFKNAQSINCKKELLVASPVKQLFHKMGKSVGSSRQKSLADSLSNRSSRSAGNRGSMTRSFNNKLNKMQQELKANFERPTGQMILVKDFQQGSDQPEEESESQITIKMQKRASKDPARQNQPRTKKKPSIVPSKNLVMSMQASSTKLMSDSSKQRQANHFRVYNMTGVPKHKDRKHDDKLLPGHSGGSTTKAKGKHGSAKFEGVTGDGVMASRAAKNEKEMEKSLDGLGQKPGNGHKQKVGKSMVSWSNKSSSKRKMEYGTMLQSATLKVEHPLSNQEYYSTYKN